MEQFTLEKYLADPTRKVVTRDGREVRIICTDRKQCNYPIVALISCDDEEILSPYKESGKYDAYDYPHGADLFFAPQKQSRWVYLVKQVYLNGEVGIYSSSAFKSKQKAKEKMIKNDGFALTEITWEE